MVKGLEKDLPKYLAERIYMFVGEKVYTEFLIAEKEEFGFCFYMCPAISIPAHTVKHLANR